MGKYFGTDGVRGEASRDLTLDMAVAIGQWLGWHYSKEKKARILIGRDTRLSGSMLELGLAAGAVSMGADVFLLGVCPTPAVSHLVYSDDFDAGIMVSASHNPFEDNGIKVFNHRGEKMEEELLLQIEDYMDGKFELPYPHGAQIGEYFNWPEGMDVYRKWMEETVSTDLSGMKIVVDLANGSACSCAAQALKDLNAEVIVINGEPDGLNINLHCGSTHPETLQKAVVDNQANAGLAFDGDADRLIAVDETGELITGDHILYILSRHMKNKGIFSPNMVVTTVMSNLGLYKALDRDGIEYIQTPVGDKYVFEEMAKNGYLIGGEQSGHIIFLEHERTGDGLMTALLLLKAAAETGSSLHDLSEGLLIFPQLLENVRVKDKNTVLNDEAICEKIDEIAKKLGRDGRILVRPSGTEPLIRVMVEAETDEICADCVHAVTDLIHQKGYAAE